MNIKIKSILLATKTLVLEIITVVVFSLLVIKVLTFEKRSDKVDEIQQKNLKNNSDKIDANRERIMMYEKELTKLRTEIENIKQEKAKTK